MNSKVTVQNVILILLFIFTAILAIFVIRPLISVMLTALIIGYIFYPVYKKARDWIKNDNIAAILVSTIIVLLIIVPTFFIVNTLANEAFVLYTRTKQIIITEDITSGFCEGADNLLCNSIEKVKTAVEETNIKYYLQKGVERFTESFIDWATDFALAVPIRIFQGFIIIFILFYFFKDYKRITDKLKLIIPIKLRYRKELIEQVENVTYAVVFGYISIALLEGLVGALGFFLFVPNSAYLFWGLIIAFLALIPLIGATVIWIPTVIIQIMKGRFLFGAGLVLCMLTTSYIDMVTRSRLIGSRANVHPVYVLLGVIGGAALMGLPGVVIGPLALAILNTFFRIFTGNFSNIDEEECGKKDKAAKDKTKKR